MLPCALSHRKPLDGEEPLTFKNTEACAAESYLSSTNDDLLPTSSDPADDEPISSHQAEAKPMEGRQDNSLHLQD